MGVGVVKPWKVFWRGRTLGAWGAAGSSPTVLLSLVPSPGAEGGAGKRVSG